jgi:uncharacterized protein YkvS
MYTKQQASELRQAFWTAFGQYMSPVLSADGRKINWINYKTGVKGVFFKINAANKFADIAIELAHADLEMQQLLFEHFLRVKKILYEQLNEEWIWELHTLNEYGKTTSRIYTTLNGVSIFKKEDWPQLISFFKQRMIALDQFWSMARYGFGEL